MRHSRVSVEDDEEEKGRGKRAMRTEGEIPPFMDDCVPRTVVIYEHYVQENPIHASPVKVIRILTSLSQSKSNMVRSIFFLVMRNWNL